MSDSDHLAHAVRVLIVDNSDEAAFDQLGEEWLLDMLTQVFSLELDRLDVCQSQCVLVFIYSKRRKRATILLFFRSFLLVLSFGYRGL